MGMQDRLVVILLLVLAAVVGLFLLVALVDWALPDAAPLGDWADIVLALVTILAILFGGLFAAVKFDLFRDFEPHLTITHTINHRFLGDSYVHIDVTSSLHNSSKVRVVLQGGYYVLQSIEPVSDSSDFADGAMLYPSWPVLDEATFDLGDQAMTIEPGQSLQEVLQFLVPIEVGAVLIHYFFYDSSQSAVQGQGWGITSVYDIFGRQSELTVARE